MGKKALPHAVVARIIESIGPLDRGEKYEDPLADALGKLGEITGGGSQLDGDGSVEYVQIDLQLADLDRALEITRSTLRSLGAPKGSDLRYERGGKSLVLGIAGGARKSRYASRGPRRKPGPCRRSCRRCSSSSSRRRPTSSPGRLARRLPTTRR